MYFLWRVVPKPSAILFLRFYHLKHYSILQWKNIILGVLYYSHIQVLVFINKLSLDFFRKNS